VKKGSREAALLFGALEILMLTTKQRQFLKGLAHGLSPVVRVGRGGLTPAVIKETKKSIFAHELIKVRIEAEESAARREIAEELARAADAQLAGTIGKQAILYRRRDEKPKIKLP
jgi:RNA-binding protein